MRPSHKARANESPMELQLGPLIDCVFLLLTYFIFTITLTTTEGLLPSNMAAGDDPQPQEQPPPEDNETIVRMVQTGARVQYFLDDWPVSEYSDVKTRIEALDQKSLVVIDAGPNVTYDHVVRVYNECLRQRIEKVVFPLVPGARGGGGGGGAAAPAGSGSGGGLAPSAPAAPPSPAVPRAERS